MTERVASTYQSANGQIYPYLLDIDRGPIMALSNQTYSLTARRSVKPEHHQIRDGGGCVDHSVFVALIGDTPSIHI